MKNTKMKKFLAVVLSCLLYTSYCKKRKEPGRLIPVPGTISAGCGLAWCVLPQEREHLLKVMEEGDITPQAVHECML